jgi:hypothetical protein
MVSLAWLGGRWVPFDRMVEGVVQFGLGALAVLVILLLVPRLFSRLEALTPAQPRSQSLPSPLPGQPPVGMGSESRSHEEPTD